MRTRHGEFTLDDFIARMGQVQKLGSMSRLIDTIPGMAQTARQLNMKEDDVERQMARMKAIYHSMSAAEREDPDLLDTARRRRRLAKGAGVELVEVSQFMKQFELSRDMMRAITGTRDEARAHLVAACATNDPAHRDPTYAYRATSPPAWQKVLSFLWPALAAILALGAWRLFR